jgi:hypothetical protein
MAKTQQNETSALKIGGEERKASSASENIGD